MSKIRKKLNDIGLEKGSNKSSEDLDVLRLYEDRLSRFHSIDRMVLLELGIHQGQSLEMWDEFFENATIVGVALTEGSKSFSGGRRHVRIGSQSNSTFLDMIIAEFGAPSIIIDNAAHEPGYQIRTLHHLLPEMKRGGAYIIEDIDTIYPNISSGGQLGLYGESSSAFEYLSKVAEQISFKSGVSHESYDAHGIKRLASCIRSIEFVHRAVIVTRL